MKNPKRPTRIQKEIIAKNKLIPGNWLVARVDKGLIHLVHKQSGNVRIISE